MDKILKIRESILKVIFLTNNSSKKKQKNDREDIAKKIIQEIKNTKLQTEAHWVHHMINLVSH